MHPFIGKAIAHPKYLKLYYIFDRTNFNSKMDSIKEIIDKISSYNIFNYLLPGILFTVICREITEYDFFQENNFIGAFLYYFIGMVISRFGSVVIEPLLKKMKFLKFADYKHFITASKKDEKIELLSEVNNTYRTIIAMLLLLMSTKGYATLKENWDISNNTTMTLLGGFVLTLFLFSYRKQTGYITKRIEANN